MKKLLLCALFLAALKSTGQNAGDLDTNFGDNGKVIAQQGEAPYNVVNQIIQPDGKTVIIGNYNLADGGFVTRFNADGSKDQLFNTGNILHLSSVLKFSSVGLQSDGKIIIGGSAFNNYAFLTRINTNGTLDTTFGTSGYSITNYSADSYWHIQDLKVLPNNKIVTVNKDIFQSPNHFEFVMYTANGSFDTSFNSTGLVLIDSVNNLYGGKIYVQADGKSVICGNYSADSINTTGFFITRLNADGSYDSTFNSGAIKFVPGDISSSFTVQADSKIVVNCLSASQTKIFRFNSNGSTDISFNSTGSVTRAIPYYTGNFATDNYSTVRVQADGKIVLVTGYNSAANTLTGKNFDIAVVRFNSNGTQDTSFDTDGLKLVSFYGMNDFGYNFDIYNNRYIISGNTYQTFFEKRIAICSVNQDGTMDATFGTDGKNTMQPLRKAVANLLTSEMQADGKIVLCGNEFVASNDIGDFNYPCLSRYNTDGSIDTSFGTSGKSIINESGNVTAFKLQSDGKMIIASTSGLSGTRVLRLVTNGSIDTTFGTNGVVTLTNQSFGNIRSIAVQTDGKIVLAGNTTNGVNPATQNFYTVRLNTNGTFDSTFGTNGVSTLGSTAFQDDIYGVKIQPNGKIVVGGVMSNGADLDIAVLRYNANGTLDTSFNGNGIFTMGIGTANDYFGTLELQADGKILGTANGNGESVLFRLTSSGAIDTDFDTDGKVTTLYRGSNIKVLPDQKIFICGTYQNTDNDDFAITKYNANGSVDPGFGTAGSVYTHIDNDDSAYNMLVAGDKVIVTGDSSLYTGDLLYSNFSMAKYHINTDLGLPENAISQFSFYPNPAKDKIILDNNISSANIFTLDGKKIESTITGNTISLNGISTGIYLIELTDNEGKSVTKKLIKE